MALQHWTQDPAGMPAATCPMSALPILFSPGYHVFDAWCMADVANLTSLANRVCASRSSAMHERDLQI
ncbi:MULTISPECIES: hypothetical protein [unclassified Massilia]|uniref:hypothetical protein n=1 Tax=unclassified Massilia TaxID=2609279 RepID=UPI001782628A|nr:MULTISPECIES: hypothetical protein [unclassified Massilia]MBD8532296.1 hypothetical protein [Massilia sp. CFBP 13647]MBD8673831.1 hypothetical protein [Massilia sp. CFBP 13721]